jgi:hypothetical protein
MTADDVQAYADAAGAGIGLAGFFGTVAIALLKTRFVTRVEHNAMIKRLEKAELGVATIDGNIGDFVSKSDLTEICRQLVAVANQGAQVIGRLDGVEKQMATVNTTLQLLIENGMRK